MRVFVSASLIGLALVSLAACNPSTPGANGSSAPGAAPGAPAAAGPISAAQFPHRRPGLWTQVTAMDGAATNGPGMQMCVDETSEARMQAFGQHVPGGQCSTPQLTRNLDGSINVSESCDMGANGKTVSTGVIRGDFNTSYSMDLDSQTSGSSIAQLNGEHKMTVSGTWNGPCAAGQRGGDMILPNGQTHNLLDDEAARTNATGN